MKAVIVAGRCKTHCKMYKCPNCGMTSETAGDCPNCKVPMVEVTAEAAPVQPQPEQAQPSQGGEAGPATDGGAPKVGA